MKTHQGATIKLAGMGNLEAVTEAGGKHGYQVQFPKGHEKYKPSAFELANGAQSATGKKATSGNFLAPLANPNGLVGAMEHCWKCSLKPVHLQVNLQKPLGITSKALQLRKDEPMLLAGPAPCGPSAPTSAPIALPQSA